MPGKREREHVASSAYMRMKYSDERAPRTPYPDRLVALLADKLGIDPPARFLDLGCGRGDFLAAFRRAGFDAIGVDIHEERHSDALRVDLEERLPFTDHEFDVVFSKSVVEHLTDATFALTEARRVLRPGGRVVVMTPSWAHTGRAIFYSEYTHVRPFTLQSITEALALAGFEDARAEYFWQLPVLWRLPMLRPLTLIPRVLRLPYRPLTAAAWPDPVNRAVRFSREVMLLATARA